MNIKKVTSTLLILVTLTFIIIINSSAICSSVDKKENNINYMELVSKSIAEGDIDNAKYYISLRNDKILTIGLQDVYTTFTYDDVFNLAATAYQEAGCGVYVDDNEILAQCNVILNRVKSDLFPNTILDVLLQDNPPQYATFTYHGVYFVNRGNNQLELDAIARSYQIALRALNGEKAWNGYSYAPDNLLYASRFVQGRVWWQTPDGTLFCCG